MLHDSKLRRAMQAGGIAALCVSAVAEAAPPEPLAGLRDLLDADVFRLVELYTPMCSTWELPGMAGEVPCWSDDGVPNPVAIAWPEFGPEGQVVRLWHVNGRVVAVWSDQPSGPPTSPPAGGIPPGAAYSRTRSAVAICGNGRVGEPTPPLGSVVLVGRSDGARLELTGASGTGVVDLGRLPPEVTIFVDGDPLPLSRLRAAEVVLERTHRLDVTLDPD